MSLARYVRDTICYARYVRCANVIFKRKSFDQTFSKVCGFSRQSLESRSAEREKSFLLQEVAALGDLLKGAKTTLIGWFSLLHPARCARIFSIEISFFLRTWSGNFAPIQSFRRYPHNFASANRDPSPTPFPVYG